MASENLDVGFGTKLLLHQYTPKTASPRYTEHSTPKRDVNLSLLISLGMDSGNRIRKEKIVPQNICPSVVYPIQTGSYSSSQKIIKISGTIDLI